MTGRLVDHLLTPNRLQTDLGTGPRPEEGR